MARARHENAERLARRAAGGDLEAARRLVYVLEERAGSTHLLMPRKAIEVAVETLRTMGALLGPGGDGLHALESVQIASKIARDALIDPAGDWEVQHRVWKTERRCRFCGLSIYDMSIYDLRLAEDPTSTVPDWATWEGYFGCERSPDTNEDGIGSHEPT